MGRKVLAKQRKNAMMAARRVRIVTPGMRYWNGTRLLRTIMTVRIMRVVMKIVAKMTPIARGSLDEMDGLVDFG